MGGSKWNGCSTNNSIGLAVQFDPQWLQVTPIDIEGAQCPINNYFIGHPDMVLGTMGKIKMALEQFLH